jgi:hypothetical protein
MWEKVGGALKMVYSAYQFAKTWFQYQQEWRYIVFSASLYFFSLSYVILPIGA